MNVLRSECSAIPSGTAPSPASARRSLAVQTAPARTRFLTLLWFSGHPDAVANTRSAAPARRQPAL